MPSAPSFTSTLKGLLPVPVIRELAAGLGALKKATSNNRTYAGLLLIMVVAPLSGVAYQLFDSSAHVDGWYYVNTFYLLYMLGPHIQGIITLTGILFLFPENRTRSFALAIPTGYHFAKVVWLIQVTSNDEINSLLPAAFIFAGICIGLFWLVSFDMLMSLHYHKRAGALARAEGILKAPNIPDSQRVSLAVKEFDKYNSLK